MAGCIEADILFSLRLGWDRVRGFGARLIFSLFAACYDEGEVFKKLFNVAAGLCGNLHVS